MIIHLTTVHPRNDTRVFERVAKSINKKNNDLALIVADGLGHSLTDGIKIIDLGERPASRFWRVLYGWQKGLLVALKFNPTIIHFHDPELLLLTPIWRILGTKVIYDVHEEIPKQIAEKRWLPQKLRFPISRIAYGIEKLFSLPSNGIVAATPTISKNFPPKKTYLVQNFPSTSEQLHSPQENSTSSGNRILYVGGITRRRSLFEILDAVQIVKKQRNLALTLAGNFSPPDLKNEAIVHPSWKDTEYLGWIDRKTFSAYMNISVAGIVLCYPEKNYVEAQPTKIFEYMWGGLPIISSDFSAWRDFTGSHEGLFFVDPLSPEEIANAIITIIDNPDWAKKSGSKLQKNAQLNYSWEHEEIKLHELYQKLSLRGSNDEK